ncbi:hypothetical protein SK128_019204, partial [Halocaridina rubra]
MQTSVTVLGSIGGNAEVRALGWGSNKSLFDPTAEDWEGTRRRGNYPGEDNKTRFVRINLRITMSRR